MFVNLKTRTPLRGFLQYKVTSWLLVHTGCRIGWRTCSEWIVECVFWIRPGQYDLEGLVSCDERRQPRQTLLPRPPDPDQQGVPLRRPEDPRDPHQVGHRILPLDQTEKVVAVWMNFKPPTWPPDDQSLPWRRPGPWLRPSPPRCTAAGKQTGALPGRPATGLAHTPVNHIDFNSKGRLNTVCFQMLVYECEDEKDKVLTIMRKKRIIIIIIMKINVLK